MRILRRLRNDEQGQSLLEFVISFPIVLFLVLAIMQFALMWNAKQVVNYAAFCAARSYIVYGIEGKASLAAKIATIPVSAKASGMLPSVSGINLASLIPSGVIGEVAYAADKFAYSYLATSIRLFDRDGRALSETGVNPERGDDITVEVTHKFRLIFPIINRLIGKTFPEVTDSGTSRSSWLQSFDSSGWSPINIESKINTLFGNIYFFPITARCTLTMEETGTLPSPAPCPYCFKTGINAGMCFTADQVERVPGGGKGYRLKREVAISIGYRLGPKQAPPFVSSNCRGLQ
jgi:Flp pilus assembly protein TadG